MSGTEIFVILFGVFVGYWVISRIGMGTGRKPPAPATTLKSEQEQNLEASTTTAWHEVLNISPHASVSEIHESYKTLIGQYHPDKVAGLGDELKTLCERKTKAIDIAYDQAMQQRGSSA